MKWIWQSPAWPRFDYDKAVVERALADAMAAIGEVRGMRSGLSAEEREAAVLKSLVDEAVASFGIEGVTLAPDEIEASVVASLKHRDRQTVHRRSDAIAEMMLAARDASTPLTAQILCDWHALLFRGIEVEDPNRWRSFDLDIVRSSIPREDNVLYKAPPPADLDVDMQAFLEWLRVEDSLPVPIRAAIAHLWFESIHPFSDGNGRIGRALIEHVFARAEALPFALSRQIEQDKRTYYDALQLGREASQHFIDATAFVLWFLQTITAAAVSAKSETLFLVQKNRFFVRHAAALSSRQRVVLESLFAQGPRRLEDGLSARSYAKISGASGPTATRDLAALERAGILRRSEAGGRSTVYRVIVD